VTIAKWTRAFSRIDHIHKGTAAKHSANKVLFIFSKTWRSNTITLVYY